MTLSDRTICVYSNETSKKVASHTAETNQECETWAAENYGSNDYHWSYNDQPISNACQYPDNVWTDGRRSTQRRS